MALSLNNCVLRCVLRVFVGVFEKLILFCGPERGEERIILYMNHKTGDLETWFASLDSK